VLLLLLFGGGGIVALRFASVGRFPGSSLVTGGRIAILPIVGVIDSEQSTLRTLKRFRDDRSVKGLVVEIRSPGGGVGASQSLYRAIRKLRDEDHRPIVAWIGDVGASGGYYVAMAADSLFALPGSITGSIGVIMEFPNAKKLLDKVGVDLEVVKSGKLKDIGSPARALTAEEREVLQGVVDDVYGQFVGAVAENRPLDREQVEALADGRIFSGERAVSLGLVDRIATLEEAIGAAGRMAGLGDHPRTVRPNERRLGLLDLMQGVSRVRLVRWLGLTHLPLGRAPRLLYEWR